MIRLELRKACAPAMQAGVVNRELTFRDVFPAVAGFVLFVAALLGVRWSQQEAVRRFGAAWR